MLGILGGSGLTQFDDLLDVSKEVIRTPYGNPSAELVSGKLHGRKVVFLARHGSGHTIPPHEINYRANIWALRSKGVSTILSVATVGGIAPRHTPGALVVPHQIIDYTWGRKQTFFGDGEPVSHFDFTEPYSDEVRMAIIASAQACEEAVFPQGVYAVTQGPRLETAAEIDRMERDGADMVGMTAMPEAVLARELGIAYGSIAVVANHAAGRGASRNRIDLDAINATHGAAMVRVRRLIGKIAGEMK